MAKPRDQVGLFLLEQYIYIIGGYSNENQPIDLCEIFDTKSMKTRPIAPLRKPCAAPSLCIFNDDFLIKIGGYNQSVNREDLMVEVYDISQNIWKSLEV